MPPDSPPPRRALPRCPDDLAVPSPLTLAARAGQEAPERGAQRQQVRPAKSRRPSAAGPAATAQRLHSVAPQRIRQPFSPNPGDARSGWGGLADEPRSRPAAAATGEPGGGPAPPRSRPRRGGAAPAIARDGGCPPRLRAQCGAVGTAPKVAGPRDSSRRPNQRCPCDAALGSPLRWNRQPQVTAPQTSLSSAKIQDTP